MSRPLQFRPPQAAPLLPLGLLIERHWKKNRPRMVTQLQKAGKLREAVYAAQELTSAALEDLMRKGQSYDQAWEQVREEWALLPSEEDVPQLGFDPERLTPPLPRSETTGSSRPTK